MRHHGGNRKNAGVNAPRSEILHGHRRFSIRNVFHLQLFERKERLEDDFR